MKKQALILSVLVLLAAAITLIGFEALQQDLVSPLIRGWGQIKFLATIIWRSQDKFLLWYIFIYIGILLALHTLITAYSRDEEKERHIETHAGPVSQWLERLESLDEGMYYRWRFAQKIRSLVERKHSSRTGLTPGQVRKAIKTGNIDLPPEFLAYLQSAYSTEIKKYFSTYRGEKAANPIRDLEPNRILDDLEEFMNN